jgi:hypothetical protein
MEQHCWKEASKVHVVSELPVASRRWLVDEYESESRSDSDSK